MTLEALVAKPGLHWGPGARTRVHGTAIRSFSILVDRRDGLALRIGATDWRDGLARRIGTTFETSLPKNISIGYPVIVACGTNFDNLFLQRYLSTIPIQISCCLKVIEQKNKS